MTMFKDFQPAIIKLKDGKQSLHKQTNIFLKNSTLVYKKVPTGEIMEASMPIVAGITMGERNFINVKNQLAEVVATEGKASLVRIRIIDVETMKGEYLNNSTITNSSMLDDLNAGRLIGESMSTTRVDGADDEEPYDALAERQDESRFRERGQQVARCKRCVVNRQKGIGEAGLRDAVDSPLNSPHETPR